MITFLETSIFTNQLQEEKISDESLRKLQNELIINPTRGDLIKESGGMRKIRMPKDRGGKSGGFRVIYYTISANKIYFLLLYPKSEQANLTPKQMKILKGLLKE